jgi:hypothetical protein
MIQQVLEEPEWLERMTPRDLAALSPPSLDISTRMDFSSWI